MDPAEFAAMFGLGFVAPQYVQSKVGKGGLYKLWGLLLAGTFDEGLYRKFVAAATADRKAQQERLHRCAPALQLVLSMFRDLS